MNNNPSLNQLMSYILKMIPNAVIGEDDDGQIVINTNLSLPDNDPNSPLRDLETE